MDQQIHPRAFWRNTTFYFFNLQLLFFFGTAAGLALGMMDAGSPILLVVVLIGPPLLSALLASALTSYLRRYSLLEDGLLVKGLHLLPLKTLIPYERIKSVSVLQDSVFDKLFKLSSIYVKIPPLYQGAYDSKSYYSLDAIAERFASMFRNEREFFILSGLSYSDASSFSDKLKQRIQQKLNDQQTQDAVRTSRIQNFYR